MNRAIITSASNKFFPSLINLLGSIQSQYPNHPPIFIYDLGLSWPFRQELEGMEGVKVLPMPHFCNFWRSCYTWKTYIFNNPLAEYNLYLDAGTQVLRPLDEVWDILGRDGYFAVEQHAPLDIIVPREYRRLFSVPPEAYNANCVTAGIFGFQKHGAAAEAIQALHEASLAGLCLGFSAGEQWKNKGVSKNQFIRGCPTFRHDTTLLNLILYHYLGQFKKHELEKYAGAYGPHDHPGQLIWNLRLNYKKLEYLQITSSQRFISRLNRVYIQLFLWLKALNRALK